MAVLLALGSALLYALKSVLQQKAAASAPLEHSLRPGLLFHLAARPLWLAGTAADGLAILLHFLALGAGSLVLVQPLLVTSLLFALPLGAVLFRHPVTARHWIGAIQVVVGLAVFLVAASPESGDAYVSGARWTIVAAATASVLAAILLLVPRQPGPARAAWLAVAAGVSYAVISALLKATAETLDEGVASVLTSWEPYALVAFGVFGLLLGQSAFQAGPLNISLPLVLGIDPVVSIALGVAFGERLATGGLLPALQLASLAVVVIGTVALARAEVASFAAATEPDPTTRGVTP
ncbi:MAG: DMT family transporter [Actinomycetota bacterium]|nr:DMT family transporter [Actinomycetota bacterium]